MASGKITRLVKDRGFGFVQMSDSQEVFFHSSALPAGAFDELREGQTLEFDVEPDPRDPRRRRAANVRVTADSSGA
jgi:CspA family cold shock protein